MTLAAEYPGLLLDRSRDGILLLTIAGSGRMNSLNETELASMTRVWRDIDADPAVRVVVVTGAGDAFCAGGDVAMERRLAGNYQMIEEALLDARGLVNNIINLDKPVISAINGPAAGGGLVVALLADISIMNESTRFSDGHINIGLAAGDHACIIWPLLCGMARAKYLLLTSDKITGDEAARIGLVSMALPADQVLPRALEVAERLAAGPQMAIRWTKRSLNHWLRLVAPIYESSQALEILNLFSPDFAEGVDAFAEKRPPVFPSVRSVSADETGTS